MSLGKTPAIQARSFSFEESGQWAISLGGFSKVLSEKMRMTECFLHLQAFCIPAHCAMLFCGNFSDSKRILRTRTVFATSTNGSTRFASEAGKESAKKHIKRALTDNMNFS
jgi:hypothetical protein